MGYNSKFIFNDFFMDFYGYFFLFEVSIFLFVFFVSLIYECVDRRSVIDRGSRSYVVLW